MDDRAASLESEVFLLPKMTYKEQLAHPLWQKKRLQILERDNFTCCICSDTETQLHIHHTEYISGKKAWEHDEKYLKCMCKDCHLVAEILKDESEISIVAIKKRLPGRYNRMIVYTIVKDVFDELSLAVHTIDENNNIKFIISFLDTSVYNMKSLFEDAKKLIV